MARARGRLAGPVRVVTGVSVSIHMKRREAQCSDDVTERFIHPVHWMESAVAGIVEREREDKQDGADGRPED